MSTVFGEYKSLLNEFLNLEVGDSNIQKSDYFKFYANDVEELISKKLFIGRIEDI